MEAAIAGALVACDELERNKHVSKAEKGLIRVMKIGLMARNLCYASNIAKAILGHLRWRAEVELRAGMVKSWKNQRRAESSEEANASAAVEKSLVKALRGESFGGRSSGEGLPGGSD